MDYNGGAYYAHVCGFQFIRPSRAYLPYLLWSQAYSLWGNLLSAWYYAAHTNGADSAMPWVAGETVEAVAGQAARGRGV